ncbi:unnamed protein product [Blepharisma stoltei]|uniref:protein disulfide-isomerase n=1 Tax=Blepharisma stoltei TaxID=1481888 RepID=A0AAU9IS69_9CILI|nr:unnamed protein product [Blepharisma stoltei]
MGVLHVLLLPILLASALYSASSPVVKLTSANFQKEVIESDDIWLVEFFAPWCGHCKQLAPEWEKAAKALKGIVKVGAVDMTTDQQVGAPYRVEGFPTIKFFGENKRSPLDYNSGRSAKEITSYALSQAEQIVQKRLGGKPSSSSSSGNSQGSQESVKDDDVIVLTDSNFEELVLKSKDMWLVEMYAPWCGHCKKLAPEWARAATQLKDSVKLGKLDATAETKTAQKYGVKGYPTIKIFPPGEKNNAEDYNGPREAEGIVRTALSKLDQYGVAPEIPQLVSAEVFKENCDKQVCIIAFLPHIYDSSSVERNRYIEVFQNVAKKTRGKPIRLMWAQAGDFLKLEQLLGLGMGYPAVAGISTQKTRYSVMKSAYNPTEIDTFITKTLSGSVPLIEYKELPKLSKVEPWDGQDHQPEVSQSEDL